MSLGLSTSTYTDSPNFNQWEKATLYVLFAWTLCMFCYGVGAKQAAHFASPHLLQLQLIALHCTQNTSMQSFYQPPLWIFYNVPGKAVHNYSELHFRQLFSVHSELGKPSTYLIFVTHATHGVGVKILKWEEFFSILNAKGTPVESCRLFVISYTECNLTHNE